MASTTSAEPGLDRRPEPGDDLAGGRDEELLEIPLDVAGLTLGVGGLGQQLIERVALLRR